MRDETLEKRPSTLLFPDQKKRSRNRSRTPRENKFSKKTKTEIDIIDDDTSRNKAMTTRSKRGKSKPPTEREVGKLDLKIPLKAQKSAKYLNTNGIDLTEDVKRAHSSRQAEKRETDIDLLNAFGPDWTMLGKKPRRNKAIKRAQNIFDIKEIVCEIEAMFANVNFDVEDNDQNILYDGKGNIKLVSFEKLIEKLTDSESDISLNQTFLLTYHQFKTPLELLLLLKRRLSLVIDDSSKSFRVFGLLNMWMKKFFYDWTSQYDELYYVLDDINLMAREADMSQYGRLLLSGFTKSKRKVELEDLSYHNIGWGTKEPPIPILSSLNSIEEIDSIEIARQMTLIENILFKSVPPPEIFTKAWTKKDKDISAPNITALVKHFNKMTYWISTEILKKDTPKKRVSIIVKFLEVATHCMELKNFMGAFEIYSGIDSSPLHRIPKTFELLKQPQLDQLTEFKNFFARDSNYITMRNELKACTPPCVPYIGVYLSDIMFISDGALDEVDGLINFSKRKHVANVLSEVMKFQETYYCLLFVEDIRDHLMNIEVWSENTLYDYASFREPKEGRTVSKPDIVLYHEEPIYPERLHRTRPNPPEFHEIDGTKKKKKKFFFM